MTQTATLIVVHNHKNHLDNLIKSLVAQKYSSVYFCDAASTDGSKELLSKSVYSDNLLAKDTLESFSKNNNDLIRHFNLEVDFYFVLNPDTFFDDDILNILTKEAQLNRNVAIIAPKVLNPDSTLQKSWKLFPTINQVIFKRLGFRKIESEPVIIEGIIGWALGAAFLVRKEFVTERGFLFDERYRLYGEDIDICFAAHLNKWQVVGTNKAIVYHSLNQMSSKNLFSKYNIWNVMSVFKFYLKWFGQYNEMSTSINHKVGIKLGNKIKL